MKRTYIKNKHSGAIFDQFPIAEIWGVTVLTHDHKVLHMRPEEHFSGSANVTWIDITNDFEVITHEIKEREKQDHSCCRTKVQGSMEQHSLRDNSCKCGDLPDQERQ